MENNNNDNTDSEIELINDFKIDVGSENMVLNEDYSDTIYEFDNIREIIPHQMTRTNSNILDDIKDNYIQSNSPLTITANNSDNSDNSDDDLENLKKTKKNRFKIKQYDDVEKTFTKYYEYQNKYSNKLDILITFFKGQKNVYSQSKNITQTKFFMLMIPSLIITIAISIFAPIVQQYKWSGGVISGLNFLLSFFVALMNYLKFETRVEQYLQLTHQYDKFETALELTNNKLMFIENENDKNDIILNKLQEIEIKVNDLKDCFNVLVPEEIKQMFPIICHINVFSLIKKMESNKKLLIGKFMDIKNEIRYILYKWNNNYDVDNIDKMKDKNRLTFLYDIKEKIKTEIIECNNLYSYIDNYFIKEIKNSEYSNSISLIFGNYLCLNKKNNCDFKHPTNEVLEKYFQIIFDDE